MIGSSPQSALRNSTSPLRPASGEVMRGRDAEWQTVRELLRRAQRGLSGVLLIDGEWGIGRSLLLRASEREAAVQGFSLAAGTADQVGLSKTISWTCCSGFWKVTAPSISGSPRSRTMP